MFTLDRLGLAIFSNEVWAGIVEYNNKLRFNKLYSSHRHP